MRSLLRYINALPISFTMKHYQVFGEQAERMHGTLTTVDSWEVLRQEHPFFSISSNREEWLKASEMVVRKDGQDDRLKERAEQIVSILKSKGIIRVFSVGSGGAALEYQIKKLMPEVRMVCSDYSPMTVERLKKVFVECDEIIQFDVLSGNWSDINKRYLAGSGLCLMYRIDAGFNDAEGRKMFQLLSSAGVQTILYIPTGTLTLLSIFNRKKRELLWFLRGIKKVLSGYVRTKTTFRSYWSAAYAEEELFLGGLRSFLLSKKRI